MSQLRRESREDGFKPFEPKPLPSSAVLAAVRIAGGPDKVAELLGVHRSQVYRWIRARTMARARYQYVETLADLSGVDMRLLGVKGLTSARD